MWKYVTFQRPGTLTHRLRPLLALALLALANLAVADELRRIDLQLGNTSYRIELAENPQQRRLGLMYREHLAADEGMLLVYPNSGRRGIWMKNVKFPLRVYWINRDFEVVAMRRLEPCRKNPCPVYSPENPARYVLELSDDEHLIRLGDRLPGLSRL